MKQILLGCLPEISSTGDFYCSKDIEVILQSIFIILNTKPESRVWQPKFGCRLKEYIWDLMDEKTLSNMTSDLESALSIWEPRINVTKLEVKPIQTVGVPQVDIEISFTFDRKDYTHVFNMTANKNMMDMSVYDLKVTS